MITKSINRIKSILFTKRQKKVINKVPETIPEAIEQIYASLPEESKEYIQHHNSSSIHFTIGMALRNDWNLWEKDSPLVRDFQQRYKLFGHADDISGLLYAAIWAKARGEDVEETISKTIDQYKKHWLEYGIDSLTGEEIA